MPITSPTISLFTAAELALVLDASNSLRHPVSHIWCRLWEHLHAETIRCVKQCRRKQLARIALDVQRIGVLVDDDASGFKICFIEEATLSSRGFWDPDHDDSDVLPRLPSLIDHADERSSYELVDDMAALAGLDVAQRRAFWCEGAEDMIAFVQRFRHAFSDFRWVVDEAVAQEGTVAMRTTFSGTMSGSFDGHPPNGRSMKVSFQLFAHVRNDRICELWEEYDVAGMRRQLGIDGG